MKHESIAFQIAAETGVPADIVLWRISKGLRGSHLRKRSDYVIYYQGKAHNLNMIAEKLGIPRETLRTRYKNGERMPELVRPVIRRKVTDDEEANFQRKTVDVEALEKKSREKSCKKMLKALASAHRDRAIYLLKNRRHFDDVDCGDVVEGIALANAARLYAAGRLTSGAGLENKAVYHG
jgi:hypothetical protein